MFIEKNHINYSTASLKFLFRKQRLFQKREGDRPTLRLADRVSNEGSISVQAHVEGKLEACLFPSGFICPLPGGWKQCPTNGLMLADEFARHNHEKATGGKVAEEEPKDPPITVSEQHQDSWDAVCKWTSRGDPNLVSSNISYSFACGAGVAVGFLTRLVDRHNR